MVDYLSKYWWVNHKQTFKSEIGGGFLWSPKLKSNGDRNYFYDTMMDAQVGDCVFSYAKGKISYFGTVVEEASTAIKAHMMIRYLLLFPRKLPRIVIYLAFGWMTQQWQAIKRLFRISIRLQKIVKFLTRKRGK